MERSASVGALVVLLVSAGWYLAAQLSGTPEGAALQEATRDALVERPRLAEGVERLRGVIHQAGDGWDAASRTALRELGAAYRAADQGVAEACDGLRTARGELRAEVSAGRRQWQTTRAELAEAAAGGGGSVVDGLAAPRVGQPGRLSDATGEAPAVRDNLRAIHEAGL